MNRMLEAKAGIPVHASGWTLAAGAFAVAVITLVACYWQTARSLVWVWGHDGTYQYAFLIFPLSLWVAFDLRHQVRAKAPAPSAWGILAIAALVCIWYAGHAFAVNLPQHFAFVALFPALVLACWGWRALWTLKFPLGYLVVFAVPWGDSMVGPLQDITAHFAVGALNVTGMPVLINGREIITPSAVWMVADACSGVKFFIACTALGCLYAYLMYHRWWKRVAFVVLAAVVPVIANGFRVYFTILIGETWGLKYATGTDHMVFGWQFFGTVLVLLLLAGWFFRDRLVLRERPAPSEPGQAGARAIVWPIALALLIAGPFVATRFAVAAPQEAVHVIAPEVTGWRGPHPDAGDDWKPAFVGAAGQFQAAYQPVAGGSTVELFHAVYTGGPRRGHNLITYGNDVYDSAKTRILASSTVQVELANGSVIAARELRLAGRAGSRLVWYWYCVDGRCTASPVLTKLLQAWAVLRGQAPQSSVWALSMPVAGSDIAQTRKQLLAFAQILTVTGGSGVQFNRDATTRGNVP